MALSCKRLCLPLWPVRDVTLTWTCPVSARTESMCLVAVESLGPSVIGSSKENHRKMVARGRSERPIPGLPAHFSSVVRSHTFLFLRPIAKMMTTMTAPTPATTSSIIGSNPVVVDACTVTITASVAKYPLTSNTMMV